MARCDCCLTRLGSPEPVITGLLGSRPMEAGEVADRPLRSAPESSSAAKAAQRQHHIIERARAHTRNGSYSTAGTPNIEVHLLGRSTRIQRSKNCSREQCEPGWRCASSFSLAPFAALSPPFDTGALPPPCLHGEHISVLREHVDALVPPPSRPLASSSLVLVLFTFVGSDLSAAPRVAGTSLSFFSLVPCSAFPGGISPCFLEGLSCR